MRKIKPPFTPEQIKILKSNPYTHHLSDKRIFLTIEAKEKILELVKQKMPAYQIIKSMGYDYDFIDRKHAEGMVQGAKLQASSERGLHVGYPKRYDKRLDPESINKLPTNPESFAKLTNEVAYLRQEVDFLKKISQIGVSKKQDE